MAREAGTTKSLPVGHRDPGDRRTDSCDECGAHDDHPKHVIAEADGSTTVRHFDCCNCIPCVVQLDHAGEKRGLELADHLWEHKAALRKAVDKAVEDAADEDEEA